MDMILTLLILIIFLLIVILKALSSKTKLLEFELNIGIKCFKLSFKTNEKSTPSDQE
ncbi:hypothetical protein [Clostridium chauvoei]|nr:hypothetical protein [Clostridium chauvoei]MBX7281211.1 hypothetical protein [Clostridium chauvoei]MBX7283693.1 hypothetical protein [Clostridium chauvoei]MBX7286301.1 hypothetical protein [Clostridium chauvoei]MBX7288698.1 hypothetical protein [Clostridium chauvoei]MBX7291296.1 hypothetical protein [Clostridium chauvoei]